MRNFYKNTACAVLSLLLSVFFAWMLLDSFGLSDASTVYHYGAVAFHKFVFSGPIVACLMMASFGAMMTLYWEKLQAPGVVTLFIPTLLISFLIMVSPKMVYGISIVSPDAGFNSILFSLASGIILGILYRCSRKIVTA